MFPHVSVCVWGINNSNCFFLVATLFSCLSDFFCFFSIFERGFSYKPMQVFLFFIVARTSLWAIIFYTFLRFVLSLSLSLCICFFLSLSLLYFFRLSVSFLFFPIFLSLFLVKSFIVSFSFSQELVGQNSISKSYKQTELEKEISCVSPSFLLVEPWLCFIIAADFWFFYPYPKKLPSN